MVYTQRHCDIVESGSNVIISFYESFSLNDKRDILFCIERYLAPYIEGGILPEQDAVCKWLEVQFRLTKYWSIREDIFELLDNLTEIEIPDYELDECGELVKEPRSS